MQNLYWVTYMELLMQKYLIVVVLKFNFWIFQVAREIEDARQKFKRDRELAEILLLQKKSIEENIITEIQKVKNEETNMIQKLEEDLKQEKIAGKCLERYNFLYIFVNKHNEQKWAIIDLIL